MSASPRRPHAPGPDPSQGSAATLHATCVAHRGRGLLILGASGSGKSAFALAMMAAGADLVADDQVEIRREGDALMARAPQAIAGLIEARGIGILRAAAIAEARIVLALDLDRTETARLPPRRAVTLCGIGVDLVFRVPHDHLAAALLQYLACGRSD